MTYAYRKQPDKQLKRLILAVLLFSAGWSFADTVIVTERSTMFIRMAPTCMLTVMFTGFGETDPKAASEQRKCCPLIT
jgi:hypothetical protein